MTLSIFEPRSEHIISVAVPVPLRQSFDYFLPITSTENEIKPCVGARVKILFGSRKLVGAVVMAGAAPLAGAAHGGSWGFARVLRLEQPAWRVLSAEHLQQYGRCSSGALQQRGSSGARA